MKRLAIVTGILALASPLLVAQTSSWAIDPAHSEADFSIRHLSISNVHGRLGKVTGILTYNEADITKSTVTANIDLFGIDTGEAPRDTHLKTPDFFATDKFPTATFVSSSVARDGSGLRIAGNLTLHGVTKSVTLAVEGPSTPIPGMDKKLHTGFSAHTTLSRADFGIGAKFPEAILGDSVKLTIELEAIKQ